MNYPSMLNAKYDKYKEFETPSSRHRLLLLNDGCKDGYDSYPFRWDEDAMKSPFGKADVLTIGNKYTGEHIDFLLSYYSNVRREIIACADYLDNRTITYIVSPSFSQIIGSTGEPVDVNLNQIREFLLQHNVNDDQIKSIENGGIMYFNDKDISISMSDFVNKYIEKHMEQILDDFFSDKKSVHPDSSVHNALSFAIQLHFECCVDFNDFVNDFKDRLDQYSTWALCLVPDDGTLPFEMNIDSKIQLSKPLICCINNSIAEHADSLKNIYTEIHNDIEIANDEIEK
ncbi:MAG: hypothetical protein LUD48_06225 [Prevotella sp.]|nr:hypothetical protein [Prevotella sp.]